MFKSAFEQQYKIFTADTGIKGLQLYREHSPDIVFLDIELPEMDGFKVLEKIKEMNSKAYVVMLSAMNINEYWLGAVGFLAKPHNKDFIEHYIGTYMERREIG